MYNLGEKDGVEKGTWIIKTSEIRTEQMSR